MILNVARNASVWISCCELRRHYRYQLTGWLRLDILQTDYAYHAESADLLADCSQEEAALLLDLISRTKQIIQKRGEKMIR